MKAPSHFIDKQKGFTIIELMVILVMIGALFTLSYQLLSDVLDRNSSKKSSFKIEAIFQISREKAIASGKIYSLMINFNNKKMYVAEYDKKNDYTVDSGLQSLWQAEMSKMGRIDEDNLKEEQPKKEIKYIVRPQNIPSNLKKIYSVSGIEITSKIINIHFYPDGTSDSIIFAFGENENYKYLFLPNQNISAKVLPNLEMKNTDEKEEY